RQHIDQQPTRADRDAGRLPPRAGDLSAARVRRRRRLDELRGEHHRRAAPGRHLYRAGSQGPEARRPAGHAVGQVRIRDQPQHRQGIRVELSSGSARHRRRGDRMNRRAVILLGGGAAASVACWPLNAHAQQGMPVIGFLGSDSPELYTDRLRALRQGLSESGYVEGRSLMIEYRWAQGRNDQLPALAADLVRQRVAALVTSTTPGALALKAATTTIP